MPPRIQIPRPKSAHSILRSELGLSKAKKHVNIFLENDTNEKRISFSNIRDDIKKVSDSIKSGKASYETYKNATKRKLKNPLKGIDTWRAHMRAAIAVIAEKAHADKKLTKRDITLFTKHVNRAIDHINAANEAYKNMQYMIKSDFEYAVGIRRTLEKINECPETYANLIYVFSKHGKVDAQTVNKELDKLVRKRSRS